VDHVKQSVKGLNHTSTTTDYEKVNAVESRIARHPTYFDTVNSINCYYGAAADYLTAADMCRRIIS